MCAIYGVLRTDGQPAAPESLDRMAARSHHRGPDDEGRFVDGACALGMRRLSIIDVAGGRQPLSNRAGTLTLVCNGEIYNFRALRQALVRRGHQFLTGSDCEVILHLYAEYGDGCVTHLNGMFAFALWDTVRRRLILGRDRLGIKPLYLAHDHRGLAFASEAKALLALPHVRAAVDPVALESYLHLGYVAAPRSLFRGITKLPPATILIAGAGRLQQQRYWRVPQDTDQGLTGDEWATRVRAQLEASVAMQMVSDVPIGAFLSGGIDSSTVVGLMARASAAPVKTYSVGFAGSAAEAFYNELPHARATAARFATDHHEILVRPDIVRELPRLIWHLDEPIADMAFVTTYLVSSFARRDVTVILSGVGGDELFGGYRRYLGHYYQAAFARWPSWIRRPVSGIGARLPADRHLPGLNALRLAKGFLASADRPFEERYRGYVQVFPRDAARALVRRAGAADVEDPLDAAFAAARGDDPLNRLLTVDAETQLPDDLLMLTDKMSMATSLECRVPLLDHTLVELAARMPDRIKIRGRRLKHAFKQAVAPIVPAAVLARRKRGFGLPMGAWLRNGLRPVATHLLARDALGSRGWLDAGDVRHLMDAHAARRVDATDPLLALMNLEIWSRLYLDGRTPADVADELTKVLA